MAYIVMTDMVMADLDVSDIYGYTPIYSASREGLHPCVRACVRACMRACVRACKRASEGVAPPPPFVLGSSFYV